MRDPRIWKGIIVVMRETQLNRWASRKTLIRRIQSELLLRSHPKSWHYLWEGSDTCSTCCVDLSSRQPMFRCFSMCQFWFILDVLWRIHSHKRYQFVRCVLLDLTRNHKKKKKKKEEEEEEEEEERREEEEEKKKKEEEEETAVAPLEEVAYPPEEASEGIPLGEVPVELRDPYLNPLEEIVMDTGSIPCSIHEYDHLSRDPTCEVL